MDNLADLSFNIREMLSEPGKSPLDERFIDAFMAVLRELEEVSEWSRPKLGTTVAEISPCYIQHDGTVVHRGGCGQCPTISKQDGG